MTKFTKQVIADRRAVRRGRIKELGTGHARVRLIRDLCRQLAKVAEEHTEAHPVDNCPCKFCAGSEARFARTNRDVATVAGSALIFADVLDVVIVDDPDVRGPRGEVGAELRRLARQADAI